MTSNTKDQLLKAYQGLVDAKYELEEGTEEWNMLDALCDQICFRYVVESQKVAA